MKANNGPNWESIKAEYVSTDISLRALGEKYGIGASTVLKRSQREKWPELRKQARIKAESKLIQKAANQRAKMMAMGQDIGVGLLKKVQAIAVKAGGQTATRVRSETVTVKHVEELDTDIPLHAMSETDLVKLAGMYATLMRTLGFDEASQVTRERLDIDRRKVELMVDAPKDEDERPVILDARPEEPEEDEHE